MILQLGFRKTKLARNGVKELLALRPYQEDAIRAILRRYRKGQRRMVCVLPTGTGKTVVFSELARQFQTRTLILVHRTELLEQAVEKLGMVWPEATPGVVQAGSNQVGEQVVVASTPTLAQPTRLAQYLAAGPVGLVVVDEAHHYVAPEYRKVLEGLGVWRSDGRSDGPLTVGFTATPIRGDRISLETVFEEVVYYRSILEMIRAGYLSDLRGIAVGASLDLSGVRLLGDDYDDRSLAQAVNHPWFNNLVVQAYLEYAQGRKALAFAVTVDHAKDLADTFSAAGVRSAYVHGAMRPKERRELIDRFRKGGIDVLCNCALLAEGFDEPSVSAILMARPTRSQALYIQQIGRGTRRYPGKDDCLVIDVVGNTEQGLVTLPTLFGLKPSEMKRRGGSLIETASATDATDEMGRVISVAGMDLSGWQAEAVDLFRRSTFRWLPVEKGALVLLGADAGNVFLIEGLKGWRAIVVGRGDQRTILTERPLGIEYAQGLAEDWMRAQGKGALVDREAPWRDRPASKAQRERAAALGIELAADAKQGEASDAIALHYAKRELYRLKTVSPKSTVIRAPRPTSVQPPVEQRARKSVIRDRSAPKASQVEVRRRGPVGFGGPRPKRPQPKSRDKDQ